MALATSLARPADRAERGDRRIDGAVEGAIDLDVGLQAHAAIWAEPVDQALGRLGAALVGDADLGAGPGDARRLGADAAAAASDEDRLAAEIVAAPAMTLSPTDS